MHKRGHISPRRRQAARTIVFTQLPQVERLPAASALDFDLRKNGAKRPLVWDDEKAKP